MDFFSAMEILSSGLSAQRTRMNVASGNLANANTTKTAEGGAYKRRDPIFVSQPLARERFGALLDNQLRKSAQTVQVAGIQEDQTPPPHRTRSFTPSRRRKRLRTDAQHQFGRGDGQPPHGGPRV